MQLNPATWLAITLICAALLHVIVQVALIARARSGRGHRSTGAR